MRIESITSALLALALLAAPAALLARSVYLNGVDITHVKEQTFRNSTVHIDKDGNIHIDAPGYKVRVVDDDDDAAAARQARPAETAKAAGGANPALSMRIYMTTMPSALAQYDLLITVGGVQRKLIKAGQPQVIMEISAWFRSGKNAVEVQAIKNMEGGRRSNSPKDSVGLIIGAGREEDKVVKIQSVFVDFKANASQIVNRTETYTVNAI